ncbi:serine/threonine-protein kinase [Sorangium cellulosum]|uniref:serine/threonine-protein kinase n=1 Tax=Sorangium cellulosum TaxID=56 RepID=UPI0003F84BE7|nr:serine/threonine-protein kinase [Sorangium cellulosum]
MATCPQCGAVYDEDVEACSADGNPLLPTGLSLPAEPLLAPHTMVGEYRIERKLGAGTFGEVYAGEHPLIGKKVAIKVLNRRFAAQPQAVARFVAEARAVNRIRQRNIIDIFSFGVLPEQQRHYFVMELLDGLTLGALCRRRRRLPFPTAVPILRGIADALDAAHEAGITHRDLKPDNVFLAAERDGTWFPKLLDFGIAKLADGSEETSTGVVLGTPQYMAPEQARGERTGPAADIYALGVMIHKMLTGKYLFAGGSAVAVMYNHVLHPPPRMSSVCPDLPRELDLPVLAMLEKRAGDRPETASKAVAALLDAARRIGLTRAGAPDGPASARRSATWAPGEGSSATEDVARESATWAPGEGSSTAEGMGTVSATWTPGLSPAATEDTATLELGALFETEPSSTDGGRAPDRRSDAGTGRTPVPSVALEGSTIAVTESASGRMAGPGRASSRPAGARIGAADPARGAEAGGRSSLRALAAVEAPPSAPAARAARRWKLLVATAAGLLAATWMWTAGRPSGLPPLDGPGAVALVSAAAPPSSGAPLASAAAAPVSSSAAPAPEGAPAEAGMPASRPAAPAEAPAETVVVRLSARPADADVWLGERRVGSARDPIALPRGSEPVALVLRKPGFKDRSIELRPDRDRDVDVSLSPLPARPRRAAAVNQGNVERLLDQRE